MSMVVVNEMYTDRPGNSTGEKLALSRSFYVETNDSNDGAYEVMQFVGIPAIGDAHPTATDMRVNTVNPTPMQEDQYHWVVKVGYEPFKPSSGAVPKVVKPWDLDPVIRFGEVARQQVMEFCYQKDIGPTLAFTKSLVGGNRPARDVKVVNSLNMPFDPPATFDEYLMTIAISKNIKATSFDPKNIYKYQNTINKSALAIAGITVPARCGYLGSYTADKAWYIESPLHPMGTAYYQIAYTITIDPDEWVRKIVDTGMWSRDDGSTGYYKYTALKDTDGKRLLEPVLLDGVGQQNPPGAAPVFHKCHVLWEEEWAGMALPTTV